MSATTYPGRVLVTGDVQPTKFVMDVSRGVHRAVVDCGYLPSVATVNELRASVERCAIAINRVERAWFRYRRRYGVAGEFFDEAPQRLISRYSAAKDWWEERRAIELRLVDEPVASWA